MRRFAVLPVLALSLVVLIDGCSRGPQAPVELAPEKPSVVEVASGRAAGQASLVLAGDQIIRLDETNRVGGLPAVLPLEPSQQEKYDAALLDALNLLADREYAQALTALESARTIQDTELVRQEIDKLKKRIEQQDAAERTVQNIQTVLSEGKADDAVRLTSAALQAFGSTDYAGQLAKLKRQADALAAAQVNDVTAQRERLRQEGLAALRDKNLRAAALAFEQALVSGDDPGIRRQLEEVRVSLTRYDENRTRAAEQRRDPSQLEDAIAALQEAARAWDTLQVRQEIDEYTLALQKRRDRLAIADFEVRGETGIPAAGRTLAEELLPAFKARFDLVERGQLARVLDELKLQATELAENDSGRREVGRLAKVRYLVLGSVTPVSGITVHARLVDVRSGLVVQTAKIVAATAEEIIPLLPQLATVLMMSDEQKIAYEAALARQAAVKPATPAPLPPPPEAQPATVPPPLVVYTPRPPEVGNLRPEDFDRLPPPPPHGQAPSVVVIEREQPVKDRMLAVSIELGDNLFRRGRFHEALRHFELAVNLYPDRQDLRLRLDRCRPHLPPPPPIVVQPRPRLAVLNFLTVGDPRVVPPGLGAWTAENIGPYFCPPYEVVDRGEVFWWMGRMGMTMHDLLHDPAARRWLGRALNVRAFVFGTLRQTASFDVTTHLVDAELGCSRGTARIHVHSPHELKLRLPELARLTLLPPQERVIVLQEAEVDSRLLVQAQAHSDRGEFSLAIDFYGKVLKRQPGNIQVRFLFERTNERARMAALEEARRRELDQQQALAVEIQRRQWELARRAEEARLRAEQEAAARAEADRLQHRHRHDHAHQQLVIQARVALQHQNFQLSFQLFESAIGLKRDDATFRELALARSRAEESARARAAEEAARREAAARRQREAEVVQLRNQVEAERRRRADEERVQRESQQKRDLAEYQRLRDEGQRLMAKEKYDAAVAAFQAARRLQRTDEIDALVTQALVDQSRATALKKDAQARVELERRLAEERARREQAEAEAKRNRELYTQALEEAQQALAQKRFTHAVAKFRDAEKIYRTDVVLTGLREAEDGRRREQSESEAAKRKQAETEKRDADLRRLIAEGDAALEAKKPDAALRAFAEANKLAPGNVDVLTGLSKAEHARGEQAARLRREKAEQEQQVSFRTLLDSGRANLKSKHYDAAIAALSEAVKIKPTDETARAALQEAQRGKATAAADARSRAEAEQKRAAYQKWMNEGRAAFSAKQYDAAINAFTEAQKILPGDQASVAFLRKAEQAKADAAAALAAAARARDEEKKREIELQQVLAQARAALAGHDLDGAAKALATASQLSPKAAEVTRLQGELQKAREAAQAEAAARKKIVDQHQILIRKGREALAARRHEEAVQAFTDASQLLPEDRTTQDLLRQAEKAQAEARRMEDADAKRKQEAERKADQVRQLLVRVRTQMKAGELDAAAKALKEASQLAPRDADVLQAQRDLDQARAQTVADAQKRKRMAAYQQAMKTGQTALRARRYDEATKAFAEAGRIMPGDRDALAALKEAEKAQADALAPMSPVRKKAESEPGRKSPPSRTQPAASVTPPEYDRHMQAALAHEKKQNFAAAARSYREALRQAPGDKRATSALAFAQHMADGQAAQTARRFAEAVRAYEAALKLRPGHVDAASALKRAREGKP